MRKLTKIVATLLVAVAAASFVACSSKESKKSKSPAQESISVSKEVLTLAKGDKEPSEEQIKSLKNKITAVTEKLQSLDKEEQAKAVEEIEKWQNELPAEDLQTLTAAINYIMMSK